MSHQPDQSAGEVAVWRSRTTGHRATAYRTDLARWRFDDPQGDGAVRCHEHGTVVYHDTPTAALHAVRNADQWCPGCATDAELVRSVHLLRRAPGGHGAHGPGIWWAVADGVVLKIEGPDVWFICPDLESYLAALPADADQVAATRGFYVEATGPGGAAWLAHNLIDVRRKIAARATDPAWAVARDAWHACQNPEGGGSMTAATTCTNPTHEHFGQANEDTGQPEHDVCVCGARSHWDDTARTDQHTDPNTPPCPEITGRHPQATDCTRLVAI